MCNCADGLIYKSILYDMTLIVSCISLAIRTFVCLLLHSQCRKMPNFSFSTAHNFLRFTPESLDSVRKRIAEKEANRSKASEKDNNETQEENIQPQLDLKVFKKLPILYGKPPPWLIGEALEDVDPYYRDHEVIHLFFKKKILFFGIKCFYEIKVSYSRMLRHSKVVCFFLKSWNIKWVSVHEWRSLKQLNCEICVWISSRKYVLYWLWN